MNFYWFTLPHRHLTQAARETPGSGAIFVSLRKHASTDWVAHFTVLPRRCYTTRSRLRELEHFTKVIYLAGAAFYGLGDNVPENT